MLDVTESAYHVFGQGMSIYRQHIRSSCSMRSNAFTRAEDRILHRGSFFVGQDRYALVTGGSHPVTVQRL